jgi:hypothetical protein
MPVQVQPKRGHNVITVDDVPLFANEDRPVGVPVQGNPKMSSVLFDGALKLGGMDGSTTGIDIHAVRLVADDVHFGAEFTQHGRRDFVRRTVGAVDDEFDPLKVEVSWPSRRWLER